MYHSMALITVSKSTASPVSSPLSWAGIQWENRVGTAFIWKTIYLLARQKILLKREGFSWLSCSIHFQVFCQKKSRLFCIRWNHSFGRDLEQEVRNVLCSLWDIPGVTLTWETEDSFPAKFFGLFFPLFFWIKLTVSDGNVCFLAGPERLQC